MPNWCDNNLTISGDRETVQRFIEENRSRPEDNFDQVLLFARSAPLPPEIDLNESGPAPAWYNWCFDNWGTKWEPSFEENNQVALQEKRQYDQEVLVARYQFQTAWSPPQAWLRTASARYQDLSFCLHFWETGQDFSGVTICAGGKVIDESVGPANQYMVSGL